MRRRDYYDTADLDEGQFEPGSFTRYASTEDHQAPSLHLLREQ
jgi:hypothetical protein